MDNNLNELIGKRIKELRKTKGYTQDEFSEMLGIDSKHLSRIECSKVQPSLTLIKKMAEIFDLKLANFFKFEHLNSREFLVSMINQKMEKLSDEKIRFIYKIIESIEY